jgi:triosephosphate isomerase (TIM)
MLIAGNWKMFKTGRETSVFCDALREQVEELLGVEVVVCPPFTSLSEALGRGLTVFAQNVHWQDEPMLLELGVKGAIVGHSERRQHFGDTDETVARRAAHALEAGLRLIACVGETEDERERGQTESVLRRQVSSLAPHERLVVAYEPVWAIGTGKTATPEIAQEAHALIRSLLGVPVLYGGSVKPENAEELLSQPDVDGALVGGASLDVDSFSAICRTAASLS